MIHHWKPIALFAKSHIYKHAINDTIYGDGTNEKEYYEWQQKVQDFVELIERTTEPSDLVVDVMAGSGTTGIAALKEGYCSCGAKASGTRRLPPLSPRSAFGTP